MESNRQALFEGLKGCLTKAGPSMRYRELGQRLDMSEAAVKMAVQRLRKRYRRLLRDEIAQTVDSKEDVEFELADLLDALSP